MSASLQTVELADLLWLAPPLLAVGVVYLRWTKERYTVAYGTVRMVLQLLLIGYLLTYIFTTRQPSLVAGVLSVMLAAAAVIALRPLRRRSVSLYLRAFAAIAVGGGISLALVIGGVLRPAVWFEPHTVIPLAGMIFANAMNAVSIAAERFCSERDNGATYEQARADAYKASLIPILNAFFAVGLVSLPGMMTGQILSGVDPLVAVRYQIMVMLMVLSSAGIASALFLRLQRAYK